MRFLDVQVKAEGEFLQSDKVLYESKWMKPKRIKDSFKKVIFVDLHEKNRKREKVINLK